MSETEREHDIEKIKRLFFDPQYGGSMALRATVDEMANAHKTMLSYINKHTPSDEQKRTERELEEFGLEAASDVGRFRQTLEQLLGAHLSNVAPKAEQNRQKFMEGIHALGLEDPTIEATGFSPDVKMESYEELYVHVLAGYYTANLQLAQAFGRGGQA